MTTTQQHVRQWLIKASKDINITHVIIATDTFDWSDYPIYVTREQNIQDEIKKPSKIMEIYSMKLDLEKQLDEKHSWHI